MDALLSVMDEGTGSPDDQEAAQPTGAQVPAAVVEDAAELSEEGDEYTPEDAIRCVRGLPAMHACWCMPAVYWPAAGWVQAPLGHPLDVGGSTWLTAATAP